MQEIMQKIRHQHVITQEIMQNVITVLKIIANVMPVLTKNNIVSPLYDYEGEILRSLFLIFHLLNAYIFEWSLNLHDLEVLELP